MASLTSLIASEASLVQEAALALPHSFDRCTHSLGPLRQAVHLCLTCKVPRGLCSACSIACHGEHEQVELFPKRAFVCDCPTCVGDIRCKLHKGLIADTSGNKYGQNFEGKFCRCGRDYDARCERETMVQCLVCEDWFHESCLNLRTRPTERLPSSDPPPGTVLDDTEAESSASNDLPPPLLPSSTYETLICGMCVISNETLRRWAGTKGIMMVVRNDETNQASGTEDGSVDPRWKILEEATEATVDIISEGKDPKRLFEGDRGDVSDEERPIKRIRTDDPDVSVCLTTPSAPAVPNVTACLAPPPHPVAGCVLNHLRARRNCSDPDLIADENLGEGDIFLTEGWRDRWCRCSLCLPALRSHRCLLEEEAIYEPPEDPDSATSLEELGMRALQTLPRDRAIDGIHAYNAMRDELIEYLRPFALGGIVVQEQDVLNFFDERSRAKG